MPSWIGLRRRTLAERAADPSGFTLVELVCAMMILAIVAGGFAVTMALGLRTVAMARQRQTASDLGTARIEHVRSVPYTRVALSSQPTHATDGADPDYLVSNDGASYDVDGKGNYETLIVDTSNGDVLHFEDPVQVGSTVMKIYQYVTWVDDAGIAGTQNYKRVTAVIQYKAPSVTGVSRIVRTSSIFTTGNVIVSGTTTTSVAATTTTTAATTTTTIGTTTTTGICPGDSNPPTGSFNLSGSAGSDAGYTGSSSITVATALVDTCGPIQFRLSNDNSAWGAWVTYDSLNPTVSWALSSGDGAKSVWLQTKDGKANTTTFSVATITLDTTKPTTPTSFTRTVTCSGANRTVNLFWGASSDSSFAGYRVYRSTDAVTWSALTTTSALSASDTHKKSLDSVRYYVVGYDHAGNESVATGTISLTKNQCS